MHSNCTAVLFTNACEQVCNNVSNSNIVHSYHMTSLCYMFNAVTGVQ